MLLATMLITKLLLTWIGRCDLINDAWAGSRKVRTREVNGPNANTRADGLLHHDLSVIPSLIAANILKRTLNIAKKLVKIQLILPNIPFDIHELADEDSPVLDFEPAVFGRC
jgi:hypothetical protein